jgi:hypothetical protein
MQALQVAHEGTITTQRAVNEQVFMTHVDIDERGEVNYTGINSSGTEQTMMFSPIEAGQ